MTFTVSVDTTSDGLVYRPSGPTTEPWFLASDVDRGDLQKLRFIAQLEELGMARSRDDGSLVLPWSGVFAVQEDDTLSPTPHELPVPVPDLDVVPSLETVGSVVDEHFGFTIQSWMRRDGSPIAPRLDFVGPLHEEDSVMPTFMLGPETFRLYEAILAFRERPDSERNVRDHRLAFSEIRNLAELCGAGMDNYLTDTIVLRPKMVGLDLERVHVGDAVSVIVKPTFDGAPKRWLSAFDKAKGSRDVYKMTSDTGGHVDVIVDDRVKDVLTEIKRLPFRRAAGPRARLLLENPVAFFSDESAGALDHESIERSLAALREDLWRFRTHVDRNDAGLVQHVDVLLEPLGTASDAETEIRRIETPDGLRAFVTVLLAARDAGSTAFAWASRDVELGTRSAALIDSLALVADAWSLGEPVAVETPGSPKRSAGADLAPSAAEPSTGHPVLIDADLVLDMSRYYDRVKGVGIETPYAIITIPLNRKGAWVPDGAELALLLKLGDGIEGTETEVEITGDGVRQFVRDVRAAEAAGSSSVSLPGGGQMPLDRARQVVDALPVSLRDPPEDEPTSGPGAPSEPSPRTGLLLESNIDEIDYVEVRENALHVPDGASAILPRSLRDGVELKEHQLDGLRTLQHLYSESPEACRGVLLADDMGLGKTLQLLAFIAREREYDPDLAPALVVAPVSLLENWAAEVGRFFMPGTLPVLTLYGAGLREHRAHPDEVDARLLESGLKRFLRPGWHVDAGIVLTTYETLRDYEFSFADVTWSIVACDEAQKIKNPNALVSRAAKKLRSRFSVAATGTPVENNLADLWSLYDFIQPGLLEPLNLFNKLYRKPIEVRGDADARRLSELQDLIRPQMIRRTKQAVAKDLPDKIFDQTCLTLEMSGKQRALYGSAVQANAMAAKASDAGVALLNLINVLRWICTDPRAGNDLKAPLPPLPDYRAIAPKLDWLITTLERVEQAGEKCIIFMDRKDIQRLVQHYVEEHFGISPDIINGETPTAGGGYNSRQTRIERFQRREGFNVLILSPIAAGVGLNIQAANHVVHYMRHWNPAKEDQATDRAYRIGQTKDVYVYTPIVGGDGFVSFDERLHQLLDAKREIADNILNGSDDVVAADLRELFDEVV